MKLAALLLTLAALPLPAQVDFATSVHPILAAHCAACHLGDHPQAGLSFATRETMLKGGHDGPAIVPGNSAASLLYLHVTGKKTPRMPMGGDPLTPAHIASIKGWIDEGAPWPESMSDKAAEPWDAPLAPRTPAVPAGNAPNPIDRFLSAYFHARAVQPPALTNDDLFVRRTYYDLLGLPPDEKILATFRADTHPDKRARLVATLLADNKNYTHNWISFWNDLLRNDQGVNYAGMRKSITTWLAHALETNMPYDEMVRELINPQGPNAPDGFLLGVNWRGDVNASQTPYMQAAQNTAQVFLGINLKCASCHDSFINRYKLRQSYGMAAIFAPTPQLELVRCDVKQGVMTDPAFLFPELGAIPQNASLDERRAAAARIFTSPADGRLARTLVNRYWQRLIGRGIVEPVDDMDARPWNPDLLDWLASDFTAHNYDLKHLLTQIMTSDVYQYASVPGAPDRTSSYIFHGPQVRRLTAEEFADTVSAVTGEWRILQEGANAEFSREWQLKSTALTRALGRPIRDQVFTTRDEDATTLQALELMNGETLAKALHRGARRLLNELPPAPENRFDSGDMRKGEKPVDIDVRGASELWLLIHDSGSYDPARSIAGWLDLTLEGPNGGVKLATLQPQTPLRVVNVTGNVNSPSLAQCPPLDSPVVFNIAGKGFTRLHGFAAVDDSGSRDDIETKVRFFVFFEKPDPDELVRVSGAPPLPAPTPASNAGALIDRLFWRLMARQPNGKERAIAREYLIPPGTTGISPSGLEDLLWSLLMHPEMQYLW